MARRGEVERRRISTWEVRPCKIVTYSGIYAWYTTARPACRSRAKTSRLIKVHAIAFSFQIPIPSEEIPSEYAMDLTSPASVSITVQYHNGKIWIDNLTCTIPLCAEYRLDAVSRECHPMFNSLYFSELFTGR
jgi:hypothetical protein